MRGKDFFIFANTLHNSEIEAARRSSVSRAYYALYHHVRECLLSSGIPVSIKPEEHERMTRYLKNSGIEKVKQVGEKMNDIRVKRNKADYELSDKSFNKMTCGLYCAMTENLLNELDSIDKGQLKRGLVDYAGSINEL